MTYENSDVSKKTLATENYRRYVTFSSKVVKEVTGGQVLTTSRVFFLLLYPHGRHKKYGIYVFGLGSHKSLKFELRSVKIEL